MNIIVKYTIEYDVYDQQPEKTPILCNIVALIKATFNVPALFILSYYIALSNMTTKMVMS